MSLTTDTGTTSAEAIKAVMAQTGMKNVRTEEEGGEKDVLQLIVKEMWEAVKEAPNVVIVPPIPEGGRSIWVSYTLAPWHPFHKEADAVRSGQKWDPNWFPDGCDFHVLGLKKGWWYDSTEVFKEMAAATNRLLQEEGESASEGNEEDELFASPRGKAPTPSDSPLTKTAKKNATKKTISKKRLILLTKREVGLFTGRKGFRSKGC